MPGINGHNESLVCVGWRRRPVSSGRNGGDRGSCLLNGIPGVQVYDQAMAVFSIGFKLKITWPDRLLEIKYKPEDAVRWNPRPDRTDIRIVLLQCRRTANQVAIIDVDNETTGIIQRKDLATDRATEIKNDAGMIGRMPDSEILYRDGRRHACCRGQKGHTCKQEDAVPACKR